MALENAGKGENREIFFTPPTEPQPICPQCKSTKTCKDGIRYLLNGETIQRWLCKKCGYRFSETSFDKSSKFQHFQKVDRQILNSPKALPTNRQGSYEALSQAPSAPKAVQTLAEVETRSERAQREGTLQSADIKGQLIEYLWYMKKKGYAESTIKGRLKLIKRLLNLGADLSNPEEVKRVIAAQPWCEGRKSNACDAYTTFLEMHGKTWERPLYKGIQKLPFIPQESEIDQLIAGCSPRMACFLQLLKETGMRPGEAWQLQWTDVDTATRTIRITPEKGSNPRIFHISAKLAAMLENLPRKYENRIFSAPGMRLDHHNDHFVQQRKRIAHKLKNPRILQITFKTFRHWKATMEYHRTKDILHVKQILGHKNINNTLIYITLAEELFKDKQEYISKVAKNVKEACALIEAGFEYVTGEYNDGGKIFRKPKYA
ncbi:MAG: tyrosine-type recombinase/integrase [Candidatus Bathyarchaeota archaeon]|nr:tyrosine-type recombinase/integrase [Candidatus Bathyarchaeota archaeon]